MHDRFNKLSSQPTWPFLCDSSWPQNCVSVFLVILTVVVAESRVVYQIMIQHDLVFLCDNRTFKITCCNDLAISFITLEFNMRTTNDSVRSVTSYLCRQSPDSTGNFYEFMPHVNVEEKPKFRKDLSDRGWGNLAYKVTNFVFYAKQSYYTLIAYSVTCNTIPNTVMLMLLVELRLDVKVQFSTKQHLFNHHFLSD